MRVLTIRGREAVAERARGGGTQRLRPRKLGHALVGLLLLVGCSSTNKRMQQSDLLIQKGQYSEALNILRRELSASPRDPVLQDRIREAKKLESRRLTTMAHNRLSAGDAGRAFEVYSDAIRYDPENGDAAQGLATARDLWITKATALEAEGRPNEAISIHEAILREFRGFEPSTLALTRIKQGTAEKARGIGTEYARNGLPGNAVIEFLQARRLFPGLAGIEVDIQEAVKLLGARSRIEVVLAIRPGSGVSLRSWHDALASRFKTAMVPAQLVPLPEVVEPVRPRKGAPGGAAGQGVSAKGVSGSKLPVANSGGKLAGRLGLAPVAPPPAPPSQAISIFRVELSGAFSKVVRRQEKSEATLTLAAGQRIAPNPEYEALKVKVDAAQAYARSLEKPVRDLQRKLEKLAEERALKGGGTATEEEEEGRRELGELSRPYKHALDEYQKLAQQLAPIPPDLRSPGTREIRYPATLGSAMVRFTGEALVSDSEGRVLDRIPLVEEHNEKDYSHPLLKATADRPELPEDLLTLPDDLTLQNRLEAILQERVASKLEQQVHQVISARWSEARRLAVAGKAAPAVEMFLMAYMADPRQAPDEAVRYITETRRAIGLPLIETLQSPTSASQAWLREESQEAEE